MGPPLTEYEKYAQNISGEWKEHCQNLGPSKTEMLMSIFQQKVKTITEDKNRLLEDVTELGMF